MTADESTAVRLIADFSVDPGAYREASASELLRFGLPADERCSTTVYLRGSPGNFRLQIADRGRDNTIFLGDRVRGQLSIGFEGSDSRVFVGRDAFLAEQHIGSRRDNDFIAIGNDVSVTGPGRWISGLQCPGAAPSIIIGDACVVARDVVIRNSDGHPVMDSSLRSQQNLPTGGVVIEPHCWLGERSAILKGVTLGAFSVIGFGAVLAADVPRHHCARGNPASIRPNLGIWCWDSSPEGLARARHYLQRYPMPEQDD